jgi:Lytic polysaccharide mono-oxygenase, cellulose-degrading
MPWISVAEYSGGQIIDVKSYLDTHHNGHMEIRACPDGEASTLQCFDTPGNALNFVEDVMWGMPADPAYPERGMYYGGQGGAIKDFHMRFKLLDHIVGNQVMLQWVSDFEIVKLSIQIIHAQ